MSSTFRCWNSSTPASDQHEAGLARGYPLQFSETEIDLLTTVSTSTV
jgi:hypothetical protein